MTSSIYNKKLSFHVSAHNLLCFLGGFETTDGIQGEPAVPLFFASIIIIVVIFYIEKGGAGLFLATYKRVMTIFFLTFQFFHLGIVYGKWLTDFHIVQQVVQRPWG